MIRIAFQAKVNNSVQGKSNHVPETFSRLEALNIGERHSIQRSLNVYFSALHMKPVSCF